MTIELTGAMVVAVAEARLACRDESDVIERLRKAMRVCRDHWMETNETYRFRSAITAAMLESTGDQRELIERSVEALKKVSAILNALQAGVGVDYNAIAELDNDVIPLNKLWNELR